MNGKNRLAQILFIILEFYFENSEQNNRQFQTRFFRIFEHFHGEILKKKYTNIIFIYDFLEHIKKQLPWTKEKFTKYFVYRLYFEKS
jgi:hypothetical protein